MPSQPQNPNAQPFDGLEPERSPDDPLERRLLADGARWRAHAAPAVEPFARRVNATLRERLLLADTPVEERPMSQRIITPPPRVAPYPPRRRSGKWGTLVAVAAAVVIVAMLAWVFQSISHSRLAGQTTTATPSPVPHITHPRGQWADEVKYTLDSSRALYVAPSDPRVAFRAISPQSNPMAIALARTTDGGATWTNVALPSDDGGWFGDLAVSPLDPQTVFLLLFAEQSDPHCPPSALGPGTDIGPAALKAPNAPHADARLGPLYPTSGGYSCSFQYVSRDGGAHWSHPTFPWPGMHLDEVPPNASPVQVQGTTLFAALAGNLNGPAYVGVRLVSSSNGGTTWSAADADIFAAGQIVSSYTLMPGTSEIYALSVPQQKGYNEVTASMVWRSEDAGAHWARVGTCPLFEAGLIGTTSTPGGPTLYALRLDTYPGGPGPIYASRDRGQTWSPVPTTGWPQNQIVANWAPNVLADGSLLLEFLSPQAPDMLGVSYLDNANATFYAWRPGDALWFQAVPPPGSASVSQTWLNTPANGPQTLWIVVHTQGTIYTVRKCVLQ